MGLARLPRTLGREANGRQFDRAAAARRRRFRYVSQQTARVLPTLPCRGSQHTAGDFLTGFVSRAACLSEPRDSGSVQPLPNREIICRSRPTSRIAFYKVSLTHFSRGYSAAFAFPYLFACAPALTGVHQRHELIGLWREHDSTGLRAEPKLIHTALAVRVARKHACKLALLPRRHGKMVRNGEPCGSPFHFRSCGSSSLSDGDDDGRSRDVCVHAGRAKWLCWRSIQRYVCWSAEPGRPQVPGFARRKLRARESKQILRRSLSLHHSRKIGIPSGTY